MRRLFFYSIPYLLGLLLASSVSSCDKGKNENEPPAPLGPPGSYIEAYTDVTRVHVEDRLYDMLGRRIWQVHLYGEHTYPKGTEKYKELSIFYGDTAFYDNRLPPQDDLGEDRSYASLPFADRLPASLSRESKPFVVTSKPIISIDAIAMDDYDEEHPAGSSLNDIFEIHYRDCWDYIQSGYDPSFGPDTSPYKGFVLLEFPEKPIHLAELGWHFWMVIKKPYMNINHKIKIIYRFEDEVEATAVLETETPYPIPD